MLPNILLKINTNNNKISNNLQHFVDCQYNFEMIDDEDILVMFNEFIKSVEITDSKVEFKKKLIPLDLIVDIEKKVIEQFNYDWEEYFKTVELYFNTFKFIDLAKCNTFHNALYNSPDADTKIKQKLKKDRKEKIYHAASLLKLVGKNSDWYVPKQLLQEFKNNKKAEQKFINENVIVDCEGKIIPLSLAVKTAEQAKAEKLNVINTIEKIATNNGWTWVFITLTLDKDEDGKSYHSNPIKGSFNYNGVSAKESAKLLQNKIKQCRSLMAYHDIKAGRDYIGATSTEAHKGGIAHKHMIIFTADYNIDKIKEIFFDKFPNLAMNEEKSFSIEDTSKPLRKDGEEYVKGKFRASATSYVFKYLMKSITAFDSSIDFDNIKHHTYKNGEEDLLTKEQKEDNLIYASIINAAFRSFNSIRGFSFFGIENCLYKFRFLARNLDKANLPEIFAQLIKSNNLYELIKNGWFKTVENIYVEINNIKRFIGCKYNGMTIIKKFFKMVKEVIAKNNANDYKELAIINREIALDKYANSKGLILDQNDTRRAKEFEKPTAKERKDWLEWVKNNPAI
jgi:hypothetical protein